MKTKLEVGKEYWLDDVKDESGTFIGLDGITLLFKPSKNCTSYCLRNGYVVFGDMGRDYCEVIPEKPWQFTTPIAMKCTEEQFNGIKDKLVEMGYIFYGIAFGEKYRYLSSNFAKDKRCITDLDKISLYFKQANPMIFESFNPDLFLSLSAMTDKEDGIKGEWWKAKAGVEFHVQQGGEVCGLTRAFFRKATAQEIIEHFEKKGKKEADRIFKLVLDFQSSLFNKINEDKTIIPIPPTKQATLFDDRVEITDWKPKEGQLIYYIIVSNFGNIKYRAEIYNSLDYQKESLANGFIKRTESEAKQLVEKLKQAML